jgi:glycogen operon protein
LIIESDRSDHEPLESASKQSPTKPQRGYKPMTQQATSADQDYWEHIEGTPFPLGASLVAGENALNFALFSQHAEGLTLLLFDGRDLINPCYRYQFDHIKNKSGPIWHCRIPLSLARTARYYGFVVAGPAPAAPDLWHHFDSAKLLLDPYAKAVHFPDTFDRDAARHPGSNIGRAPLGMLEACVLEGEPPPSLQRRQSGHIIYEVHVRGFTRHPSSGVSASNGGTFAGLIEKIPYLVELGVTAVELMPIFQLDPQANNYWGYMPLNFFSPNQGYSCTPATCSPHEEFRDMVGALHRAGIEVILDVVYNHTCEGDENGPCYSFKGIDNCSYYIPTDDPRHPYANYSGTGNTLQTANRAVRRLIVDSLRYWVKEMQVDGFRFDLASIFARSADGSLDLATPPIFDQIAGDADFDGIQLIAEPWDAGGLYQLGSKFPGLRWMQWNARYRDTLQQFVRGDGGLVPELMTRLYGSSDLFPDDLSRAYRPYQSVNYVTSHDGFTLCDLVSCNEKHNLANGHNNTDGTRDYSWNCGFEGEQGAPAEVLSLRKRQVKNFFALLMLSAGTPMFRMGDEFMQTQGGNNNPYNQDNETTWLDWRRQDEHGDVFRFCREMIRFRKLHHSIARPHFWREDIFWYGVDRPVDMSAGSHALAFCLHGEAYDDVDLYVMINAAATDAQFGIHEGTVGSWRLAIDTAQPSPQDILEPGAEPIVSSAYYPVQARSVVVLLGNHRSPADTKPGTTSPPPTQIPTNPTRERGA